MCLIAADACLSVERARKAGIVEVPEIPDYSLLRNQRLSAIGIIATVIPQLLVHVSLCQTAMKVANDGVIACRSYGDHGAEACALLFSAQVR